MAEILISHVLAQREHPIACAWIEAKIRVSFVSGKNDRLDSFIWAYDTGIRMPYGEPEQVFANLTAIVDGIRWSSQLWEVPKACIDYWDQRRKGL